MTTLSIGGHDIEAGTTVRIELPTADLYTGAEITMPVYVKRAKKDGPVVFVSAAVHGDELNGIEIIRRLIGSMESTKLKCGTLIAVPMVNVYGVLNQSRYMPDRRDLNRSFPGSSKGSLAGRVADRFLTEIVSQCQFGIDLHTGAIHRSNLPQIRANLDDQETLAIAEAFNVPVLLNANLRDGSLRQAAAESGAKILVYEAGQALRFDELSITVGVNGVINVLRHLGMITKRRRKSVTPFIATNSSWVRADCSGFVRDLKKLGDAVDAGEPLAEIGSPFGDQLDIVKAAKAGVVIGKQNIPLVHEGDAMFHIAFFEDDDEDVTDSIELLAEDNYGPTATLLI